MCAHTRSEQNKNIYKHIDLKHKCHKIPEKIATIKNENSKERENKSSRKNVRNKERKSTQYMYPIHTHIKIIYTHINISRGNIRFLGGFPNVGYVYLYLSIPIMCAQILSIMCSCSRLILLTLCFIFSKFEMRP